MTKQTLIPPPAVDTTETLLQGLIAECGEMIREHVRPAIEATDDPYRKSHLVHAAIDLMKTGAVVADSIGHLRGGQQAPELRQRITVERIQSLSTPKGEGG
jgi:hypothetical protein